MGGLIADVSLTAEDVKAVCDDLVKLPGLRKMIRPNPLLNESWKDISGPGITVLPRQAHVLDLRDGFDHIWNKKFETNTRRNLRKAESNGLRIECDQTGKLIPVFYQLFLQSIERWADHQHEPHWLALLRARRRDPIEKFELMARHLGSAFRLWVAWHGSEPAAAILVLLGANAHYTRGAMNIDVAGPTRANDLLHRYAIEDACKSGCRFYHMGETGKSDSLARFKGRFGAEAVPYAEYRIERLPITRMDGYLRGTVKKVIGFKDA
jgi:lipid II:glycine glycyltransferase (peptidoglycan interpeptide bridge formation enzyme)